MGNADLFEIYWTTDNPNVFIRKKGQILCIHIALSEKQHIGPYSYLTWKLCINQCQCLDKHLIYLQLQYLYSLSINFPRYHFQVQCHCGKFWILLRHNIYMFMTIGKYPFFIYTPIFSLSNTRKLTALVFYSSLRILATTVSKESHVRIFNSYLVTDYLPLSLNSFKTLLC